MIGLSGLRIGLIGPLPPPAEGLANQSQKLPELLRSTGAKVTLVQTQRWAAELELLADHFVALRPQARRPRWLRAIDLARHMPGDISHDATAEAREGVRRALMSSQAGSAIGSASGSKAASNFDLVVFDFVHATELVATDLGCASVCFTQNVLAEIFERHTQTTQGTTMGWVWASHPHKMCCSERDAMQRYTRVVAVSERDAKKLAANSCKADVDVILTAVDLDFFSRSPPAAGPVQVPTVAVTGSMDWAANVDGLEFSLSHVWPLVLRDIPNTRFVVVGSNPPASLPRLVSPSQGIELTVLVDDLGRTCAARRPSSSPFASAAIGASRPSSPWRWAARWPPSRSASGAWGSSPAATAFCATPPLSWRRASSPCESMPACTSHCRRRHARWSSNALVTLRQRGCLRQFV